MMNKILLTTFVCLVGVSAKTDRETVELHCQAPPKDGMVDKDWAFNAAPTDGWYIPLFVKTAKRSNVEDELFHLKFVGNPENGPFCPRLSWTPERAIFSYYGQEFVLNCENDRPFSYLRCKAKPLHPLIKTSRDGLNAFITLTDNQSFLFFFRCWDDGHKDWGVLSSTKTLSESNKELILDEVQSIGFDRNEYYDIGYENCGNK